MSDRFSGASAAGYDRGFGSIVHSKEWCRVRCGANTAAGPWLFAGQVHPTVHEQLFTMAHDTHLDRGLAVPAWGREKDGLFR
jgi:hypothetical protein